MFLQSWVLDKDASFPVSGLRSKVCFFHWLWVLSDWFASCPIWLFYPTFPPFLFVNKQLGDQKGGDVFIRLLPTVLGRRVSRDNLDLHLQDVTECWRSLTLQLGLGNPVTVTGQKINLQKSVILFCRCFMQMNFFIPCLCRCIHNLWSAHGRSVQCNSELYILITSSPPISVSSAS